MFIIVTIVKRKKIKVKKVKNKYFEIGEVCSELENQKQKKMKKLYRIQLKEKKKPQIKQSFGRLKLKKIQRI